MYMYMFMHMYMYICTVCVAQVLATPGACWALPEYHAKLMAGAELVTSLKRMQLSLTAAMQPAAPSTAAGRTDAQNTAASRTTANRRGNPGGGVGAGAKSLSATSGSANVSTAAAAAAANGATHGHAARASNHQGKGDEREPLGWG